MIARLLVSACLALLSLIAQADEVRVATAANFVPVLQQLAKRFESASGHRVLISAGSSGKLYAQIKNGAPYDVLLSADVERPQHLEREGDAIVGTRFTYARGRLVVWYPNAGLLDAESALKGGGYRHLAIANPTTAPYGAAALTVLQHLDPTSRWRDRLVQGEDIGQTFQFVATGNADLGFVALSQILALPPAKRGSYWVVPASLYTPIEQQAVLLARARDNAAARAFLAFLQTPEARMVIEHNGYGV